MSVCIVAWINRASQQTPPGVHSTTQGLRWKPHLQINKCWLSSLSLTSAAKVRGATFNWTDKSAKMGLFFWKCLQSEVRHWYIMMMGVGGWAVVSALHLDSWGSLIFCKKPQKLEVLLLQTSKGLFTVNEPEPDRVCAERKVWRTEQEESGNYDQIYQKVVFVTLYICQKQFYL